MQENWLSANWGHALKRALPGIILALATAAAARLLGSITPPWLSEVPVAIAMGIGVANLAVVPPVFNPGIAFAQQRLLRAGIILLGAQLSIAAIVTIGSAAIGLIILAAMLAMGLVLIAARILRVEPRIAVLIAVGTAICGNSAIAATAPIIEAKGREISFAVATITSVGVISLFAYPIIGHWVGLSDTSFGLWSGVAINDTSQVVAAASSYSPGALDVAAVVKLVRNTLMLPAVLAIAWWWARSDHTSARREGGDTGTHILRAIPVFVFGFLAMAGLRSFGAIDATLADSLEAAAKFLILVALAAVGLNTRIDQLRSVGMRPFALGLGAGAVMSVLAFAVIQLALMPV